MNANILSSPSDLKFPSPSAAPSNELVVGGITPFTTIDFPGRLAAVLYTQGCAWRCRYCHNSHLQPFQSEAVIPFHKVRHFLEARKGLLDGVVFCGGEPTLQPGLGGAMREVKALGFQVALHTAGMQPDRFLEVLPLCDWVGMDVKAPFRDYEKITQIKNSGESAERSLKLLLNSGIEYEVRNTFHPELLSETDMMTMAEELSRLGVKNFVIQAFRPQGCSDETLKAPVISTKALSEELKQRLSGLFKTFKIRDTQEKNSPAY